MLDRRMRRSTAALVGGVTLAMWALSGVSAAGAITLNACVNKKSGVARLYAGRHKCRKSERSLALSTQGPAGAPGLKGAPGATGARGATGSAGANGTNGAVAGYSAQLGTGHVTITGTTEAEPTTILSRTLPPGNFVVNASAELVYTINQAGAEVIAICSLTDTPTGGGEAAHTQGIFAAPLNFEYIEDLAAGSVPLALAVSSPTQPSTIALSCYTGLALLPPKAGPLKAEAQLASIFAMQTSSNS